VVNFHVLRMVCQQSFQRHFRPKIIELLTIWGTLCTRTQM